MYTSLGGRTGNTALTELNLLQCIYPFFIFFFTIAYNTNGTYTTKTSHNTNLTYNTYRYITYNTNITYTTADVCYSKTFTYTMITTNTTIIHYKYYRYSPYTTDNTKYKSWSTLYSNYVYFLC